MSEQTIEVVNGDVGVNPITSDLPPTASAEGARVGETQFRVIKHDKALTEPHGEDEEFLAQLKEYHDRRFSDEW